MTETMKESNNLVYLMYSVPLIKATIIGNEKLKEVSGFEVAKEWPGMEFSFYLPFALKEIKENLSLEKWNYLIIHKESRTIIGEVSIQGNPSETGIAEIGYSIAPDFRKKGYGKEAVQFLISEIQNRQIEEIHAKAFEENKASQKILLSLGFKETGTSIHGENDKILHYKYVGN
ncbi:GNAT family N-acetyltransferase [Isobaculum melis]|uniref:Acetyltransferase (GNAT) domain-containing protein n=1 Tax=Isobaculum melis TaxID=142588 RepID=A0A1H9RQ64_9LACT|nr:GNAT family N-acetyltransferase [Isobaculum melis]SER75111.1 Acetyltransferase (GNAT) domain-containing protein [Isobaculum melis]